MKGLGPCEKPMSIANFVYLIVNEKVRNHSTDKIME